MNKVTLEDVSTPKSSNIAQKDLENNEGIYPIYGASGFIKNVNFYRFETEYIGIVKDGAGVGRVMKLPAKSSIIGTIQGIIPNEKIEIDYLYYFLKARKLDHYYTGATIPHIYYKDYKKEKIELINKEEQKNRAKQLNIVQRIIELKEHQINELNELIKSQFVEMFENKNFELKTLNDVSTIKGEYGSGASAGEFIEGQPRYVRITDIQEDGRLNNQSIASPKNEENIDKYVLKYGDVLFARTGATVGKTYKYNENDGYCIYAGYCIRFRLDLNICNPDYIYIYTKTDNYKKWVENKQRVVAQPNINAKEYGNDLKIPIPPIELQNKFADFVKQIDKQKFEIENSLKEMQELYESLMDKYFG